MAATDLAATLGVTIHVIVATAAMAAIHAIVSAKAISEASVIAVFAVNAVAILAAPLAAIEPTSVPKTV